MAINEDAAVGAIEHGSHTAFEEVESNADTLANQVGGEYGGFLAWKAGSNAAYEDFAGFDSANRQNFNDAVTKYINSVNDILDGFNSKQDVVLGAFKGEVATSLETFFNTIKNVCQSYVNAINEEKAKVLEAQENWERAAQSVAGNISDDASAVNPVVINN